MHDSNLEQAFTDLVSWCRERDFAGNDPFDGLNSQLFQATPLRHSRAGRLAWTQLLKRSPINLRPLAGVPLERNSKGIALFALAALADYRRRKTKEAEMEARELLDDLFGMRLSGFSGAAWGYNFDWQGRAFFAPRGTPTAVPTAFAARAFIEAAQAFEDKEYLRIARSACDFILNDLNQTEEAANQTCFSYSPFDRTRVFNASLLAAETLSSVSKLTGERDLCEWARRAARYVVRYQHEDGSWAYGADDYQSWVDNFHTAFVLSSLSRIIHSCSSAREEFETAARRGYDFWRKRFFLADGWPKYYADRPYPADTHSAGAAIVTLLDLQWLDSDTVQLVGKIARWTVSNLRSARGFFFYQRRRFYAVRIPFMRWSQSWMAYALARLLEEKHSRI